MAKYISFFQSQLGYGLGAVDMLLELVRDNQRVLDRISEKQIESFIYWLRSTKDPAFLTFLQTLCVCENLAISKLQEFVFQRLVATEAGPLLYQFAISPVGVVTATLGDKSMPIEECVKDPARRSYIFAQIELMAMLCYGRNSKCASTIHTRFCDFDACFACIANDRLPDDVRRNFVELMKQCFVDVEPNRPIVRNLQLTFTWNELSLHKAAAADGGLALTGQMMDRAPKLRDVINE